MKRKKNARTKKLEKMAKLAESVMDYCQGDRWEREHTQKDRDAFYKLYDEVFGKEGDA